MLENSICLDDDLLVGEILEQVIDLSKEEQEKVVEARTEDVVVLPDSEMQVLSRVTVKGVTAEIDDSIKPENIKLGATILGVAGNVAPDKPDQSKVVKPSVSKQVVRADTGYELESVEVEGVTSEIDGNIQAENIRYGVEILGVVGSMEQKEDLDAELSEQDVLLADLKSQVGNLDEINLEGATATESDVLAGKTFFSGDAEIKTGTLEVPDLSATTATEEDVVAGKQFYNAQGELKTGAFKDMLQARIDENNNCDYLFYECRNNKINYINNLDTSKVTSMNQMFNRCTASEIDVSGFDTSNVDNMTQMFNSCSNLTEIDISNFNMDKLTQCAMMFYYCKKLTKVMSNENHSTTLITMDDIFSNCISLTNIDLSKWYVKPLYMGAMFNTCSALESVDMSNLDTSEVTSLYNVFNRCGNLTNIVVGDKFDTSKVANLNSTFYLCGKLETLPKMNAISVTTFSNFIAGCTNLKNMIILNIKKTLQIGSGTSWGTMLTNESLINTFKELWDLTGSTSQTLTLSTTSKENIANVYVKLVDVTDEMIANDPYASNKKPCVVCESTDEGAMTLTEYAISKNWSIA